MLSFVRFLFSLALVVGCCQSVRAQNESSITCIEFYDQAKKSVLGDDGNRERLLNAFNPLSTSSPHLVWVFYYVNGSNSSYLDLPSICRQRYIPSNESDPGASQVADYAYVLADQPLWLDFDIKLLTSLSPTFTSVLDFYGTCLHLIINPPCNETNFVDQLGLLTSLVSESFNYIMLNQGILSGSNGWTGFHFLAI